MMFVEINDVTTLTNISVCNPGDAYARISGTFPHTSTTTELVWIIRLDDHYYSPWGFKDHTILARACDYRCASCFGHTND